MTSFGFTTWFHDLNYYSVYFPFKWWRYILEVTKPRYARLREPSRPHSPAQLSSRRIIAFYGMNRYSFASSTKIIFFRSLYGESVFAQFYILFFPCDSPRTVTVYVINAYYGGYNYINLSPRVTEATI